MTAAVPDPFRDPEWEDRYQRGFTCPTCRGIGQTLHNDLPDGSGRARGCMTCDGTGVAPAPAGRADDRDTAASVATSVPDPSFRDRLVRALESTFPECLQAEAIEAFIAVEVEARVQAAAEQRAAEAIRPFEELFACDPDTSCRTTWRREPGWSLPGSTAALTECVEVPMGDLRAAFDRAAALASPAPAPHGDAL